MIDRRAFLTALAGYAAATRATASGPRRSRYVLAAGLYVAAILSKPNAVALPVPK